jgi:hypothetical protein
MKMMIVADLFDIFHIITLAQAACPLSSAIILETTFESSSNTNRNCASGTVFKGTNLGQDVGTFYFLIETFLCNGAFSEFNYYKRNKFEQI